MRKKIYNHNNKKGKGKGILGDIIKTVGIAAADVNIPDLNSHVESLNLMNPQNKHKMIKQRM